MKKPGTAKRWPTIVAVVILTGIAVLLVATGRFSPQDSHDTVGAYKDRPAQEINPPSISPPGEVDHKTAEFEVRLDRVETRLAGLDQEIERLDTRLKNTEDTAVKTAEKPDRIKGGPTPADRLRALERVRIAINAGRSYAGDLAVLTQTMPSEDTSPAPALSVLRGSAATGVAHRSDLSHRFTAHAAQWADMADTAANHEPTLGTNQPTLWQRIRTQLTGLVRIRQTGDLSGDTPEARVARGERHLEAGNLQAAAAEIAALATPTAQTWAKDAQRRAKVETALHELTLALFDPDADAHMPNEPPATGPSGETPPDMSGDGRDPASEGKNAP